MNKIKIAVFTIVAVTIAVIPTINAGANSTDANYMSDRYIVTFKDGINSNKRSGIKNTGASTVKELAFVNSIVIESSDANIASKIKKLDGVQSVVTDAIVSAYARKTTVVTQPAQTTPWGISQIDAPSMWSISRGGGVKVGIIDTGIDKTHPDLAANIAGGINFVRPKNPTKPVDPSAWTDDNGHGTHVAGTIAAIDNTIGVVGVAPNAKLYGIKVLNSSGSGYLSDIISGIEWSINNDMDVINMSLGSSSDVQALHDAVDAAYNAGIVVIAAAGNEGDNNLSTNEIGYPAKYSSVIAVAATDANNIVATFSSDGDEVEVSAPGVSIYSTLKGGTYTTMSGTSMASPHAAGTAAAILASPIYSAADIDGDGTWSNLEVRLIIQRTADDLGASGHDNFYGFGLIDAQEAVTGL